MKLLPGSIILILGLIFIIPIAVTLAPLLAILLVGWLLIKWLDKAPEDPTIPNQDVGTPPHDVAEGVQPPSTGPFRTR
jgi:hypothetical protein